MELSNLILEDYNSLNENKFTDWWTKPSQTEMTELHSKMRLMYAESDELDNYVNLIVEENNLEDKEIFLKTWNLKRKEFENKYLKLDDIYLRTIARYLYWKSMEYAEDLLQTKYSKITGRGGTAKSQYERFKGILDNAMKLIRERNWKEFNLLFSKLSTAQSAIRFSVSTNKKEIIFRSKDITLDDINKAIIPNDTNKKLPEPATTKDYTSIKGRRDATNEWGYPSNNSEKYVAGLSADKTKWQQLRLKNLKYRI